MKRRVPTVRPSRPAPLLLPQQLRGGFRRRGQQLGIVAPQLLGRLANTERSQCNQRRRPQLLTFGLTEDTTQRPALARRLVLGAVLGVLRGAAPKLRDRRRTVAAQIRRATTSRSAL